MIRLNKFIADAGLASRRHAEQMILEGRVTVNGRTATIGESVDPERDRIMIDGTGIKKMPARLYLVMNKPREVLCTAADADGRRTVYDLLPDLPSRVHSVGRLDFMSEGLLIFTNDGDLTRLLTHPSGGMEREYEVKLQGPVRDWVLGRLVSGVMLKDGMAKALRVNRLRMARTNEWLSITLAEGRYREVRRMFEEVGYNVLKLRRVRFGPIQLGDLPIGRVRELTPSEIDALKSGRATPLPKPGTVQKKHVSAARKQGMGWAVAKPATRTSRPSRAGAPARGRGKSSQKV